MQKNRKSVILAVLFSCAVLIPIPAAATSSCWLCFWNWTTLPADDNCIPTYPMVVEEPEICIGQANLTPTPAAGLKRLSAREISRNLSGKSINLDSPEGERVTFEFDRNGTVSARSAGGSDRSGTGNWTARGGQLCVQWDKSGDNERGCVLLYAKVAGQATPAAPSRRATP